MSDTRELKNFEYEGICDIGKVRNSNEDFIGYFDTVNGHIFVVCDGMGGHNAGERASQQAVNSVKFFFSNFYYTNIEKALQDAISYANKIIYDEASEVEEYNGMGCTIVICFIRDNKIYYAHVGDSRIYVHSKRKLKRLTKDHSVIQILLDQKKVTPKEAKVHPRRNEITKALGINTVVDAEISVTPFQPANNDIFLLCSDGLTSMLNDRGIEKILNEKLKLNSKAKELLDHANLNGGNDNISIQLIRFYNLSDEEENETENKLPGLNLDKVFSMRNILIALGIVVVLGFIFINNLINNHSANQNFDSIRSDTLQHTKNVVHIYSYKPEKNEPLQHILYKFNLSKEKFLEHNQVFVDLETNGVYKIPVKKIHSLYFFENLKFLSRIYKSSSSDIIKANSLKDYRLISNKNLVIPLSK